MGDRDVRLAYERNVRRSLWWGDELLLMVSGGGFRLVVVVVVLGIDWVKTVRSVVGDSGRGKSGVSVRKLLRNIGMLRSEERWGGGMV